MVFKATPIQQVVQLFLEMHYKATIKRLLKMAMPLLIILLIMVFYLKITQDILTMISTMKTYMQIAQLERMGKLQSMDTSTIRKDKISLTKLISPTTLIQDQSHTNF